VSSKVSVIVPLKSPTKEFGKHIQSLLAIDYPDFDIIVVDDGMKKYPPALEQYKKGKIKIIKSGGRGPSFARNLAAQEADADYIAFTDSDCLVTPSLLRELLRGFNEFPQAVACGGSQGLPPDACWFEKKVFAFLKKMGFVSEYVKGDSPRIQRVRHNASCNVMYKRDIFIQEKGFLEGLWPGEDVEFDYRLIKKGYALIYNPKALVYHYRPKSVKLFCLMMYRYGRVQAKLLKKHGFFRKIQAMPLVSISLLALLWGVFSMNKPVGFAVSAFLSVLFFVYFFDVIVIFLAVVAAICWHGGFLAGLVGKGQT